MSEVGRTLISGFGTSIRTEKRKRVYGIEG